MLVEQLAGADDVPGLPRLERDAHVGGVQVLPQDGRTAFRAAPLRRGDDQAGRDGAGQEERERREQRLSAAPPPHPFAAGHRSREDGRACEPAIQIVGDGFRRAVPALGLLVQTLQADRFEIAVHRGVARARR